MDPFEVMYGRVPGRPAAPPGTQARLDELDRLDELGQKVTEARAELIAELVAAMHFGPMTRRERAATRIELRARADVLNAWHLQRIKLADATHRAVYEALWRGDATTFYEKIDEVLAAVPLVDEEAIDIPGGRADDEPSPTAALDDPEMAALLAEHKQLTDEVIALERQFERVSSTAAHEETVHGPSPAEASVVNAERVRRGRQRDQRRRQLKAAGEGALFAISVLGALGGLVGVGYVVYVGVSTIGLAAVVLGLLGLLAFLALAMSD